VCVCVCACVRVRVCACISPCVCVCVRWHVFVVQVINVFVFFLLFVNPQIILKQFTPLIQLLSFRRILFLVLKKVGVFLHVCVAFPPFLFFIPPCFCDCFIIAVTFILCMLVCPFWGWQKDPIFFFRMRVKLKTEIVSGWL
jgi:hypothetical protein